MPPPKAAEKRFLKFVSLKKFSLPPSAAAYNDYQLYQDAFTGKRLKEVIKGGKIGVKVPGKN